MVETTANGDVQIAYERTGAADGAPLLLIMGIGGQMIDWPQGFCDQLVERGFAIARYDNRDAGLSTRLSEAGRPGQLTMLFRPAAAAVYHLTDMADDAGAVLDALGWSSAHVVGLSEGGMIAQVLAVQHPDRVRSLSSIASTPDPRIGRAPMRLMLKIAKIAQPKRLKTPEQFGDYLVALAELVGSPAYPADENELRARGARLFERGGIDLAAIQRQTAAIAAAGDRRAELARISVPTLVIHGEDDRLIGLEAGSATAAAINGARLVTYPGMGHDLPTELWPDIVEQIAVTAGQADAQPASADDSSSGADSRGRTVG
jgi:pimeloyl-ACP methyl ester carboxylesterase